MQKASADAVEHRVIQTDEVANLDRYQLLTSLVVPRPIGWVSTYGKNGVLNVAPFSFFSAVAASPMLVSVSIGTRMGTPKDSLRNILDQKAFCVNIVTEVQAVHMNETSADFPPEQDEFKRVGLPIGVAANVNAPYVANCPAVLECELFRELNLGNAGSMIVGEVKAVRLDPSLEFKEDSFLVDTTVLKPVARLGGSEYTLLGDILVIPRPTGR
ncbi:MAG TPA: flavin reductase family protein [Gemmatimonadetes bacterium]|nr:flavin reductase family protein [Gemmatimonadota bacterium]